MVKIVGVLGGGQLGQMLAEAARPLGVRTIFLDTGDLTPAKQVGIQNDHIDGSFKDADAVKKLAAKSDVVTIEIEHVDTETLKQISEKGADVQPHWSTIRTIQDKYLQKGHLHKHDVATADSIPVDASMAALEQASEKLGLPFMLKTRKDAYDGKGNFPVKSKDDFNSGRFKVILQLGRERHPTLGDIPHVYDYTKTADDRQVFDRREALAAVEHGVQFGVEF